MPERTLVSVAEAHAGAVSLSIPVGGMVAYPGKVLPAGWLWCDGKAFSEARYPVLFAVLGSNRTPKRSGLDAIIIRAV